MSLEIQEAIKTLAVKITAKTQSDDAMRYSQSMLNLAHVLSVLSNIGQKPGT